ncbi:hypothetical protein DNHGIG_21930 [Collibacillus ludicampi]|uniref:DUF1294 domain-containing protein n=1 Tax=Collibacillus ludicampi TaxID=2771369 RepID=A0AAV4LGK0_9BACL|nr:hypothetical protein DNHGIG_21930 [Collibacillus ludicampi]
MLLSKILWGYVILANLFGWASMGYDKLQAKRHGRRLPEKRLFLTAFLGGAIGLFVGMCQFHHKTRHRSFQVLVPMAILFNIVLYVLVLGGR